MVKAKGYIQRDLPRKTYRAPTSTTQGKLNQEDLKNILNETYRTGKGANQNYKNLQIDRDLSSGRVKVYHDPNSGKTVVAHRGSTNLQDWKENAMYTVGIKKKGKGYKKSESTQKAAEAKYGTSNLETVGHSKGALHAQQLGQHGIVQTVNKPVSWGQRNKVIGDNQTDYKNSRDPVSILRGMQKGNKAVITKSSSYNPLTNHSIDATVGNIKKAGSGFLHNLKNRIL
jgi:hypothetical protein